MCNNNLTACLIYSDDNAMDTNFIALTGPSDTSVTLIPADFTDATENEEIQHSK